MSYSGADSWAGYGGVSSVRGMRHPRRRDRDRQRDDRDYHDDRRGDHHSNDLHSNHGSDYRSDHRSENGEHHGGRNRGGRYRGGHTEDYRGHRDRGDRDDHERPNRRYSDLDDGAPSKGGREKGHGKGKGKNSNRSSADPNNGLSPSSLDDNWRQSVPSQVTYTGGLNPLASQPPMQQEYSRAEALRRDEQQAVHSAYDSSSVLSTPSSSVPPNSRQVGDDLVRQASRSLDEHDLSGVNRVLMRLAKVENHPGAKQDPKWKELLERTSTLLTPQQASALLPKDLADLAFALGKLQLQDPCVNELLHRLADIAKYRVEHFTAHDMSGMVWGFASLGVRNESLMSVTAAEVVNKISNFDQRQLSNTAWAFAKCGLWNEQLVNAIASECLSKIATFTAQSLSHISWAMAQWGTRREDLMDAISCEAQRKIPEFAPPSLAMIAWSFASLQLKSIHLMTAISSEAMGKICHFKTQDLAHLAWAFANLRIQDAELFDKMAEKIKENIKGTLPPELSNIAWAFSKNGLPNESLMAVIASEAIAQIRSFKPAEIAMLTWAFAVAGLQNKELMTEIGAQVGKRIERYSAPQLSHIAWAFGALSLRHSEFLVALSTFVHGHMDAFKAQGLSNIAWALAMVSFRDDGLLLRIAPEIARDVGELRPLALARCAWAYRVLTVQCPKLMAAITQEAAKKVAEFPTKALAKLVDAVFVVPEAGADARVLEQTLDTRVRELVDHIVGAIRMDPRFEEEKYAQGLIGLGLLDVGLVGTPSVLKRLEIDMPSMEFVDKCVRQAEHLRTSVPNPELAIAQVNLELCTSDDCREWQCRWEDFLVRSNAPGGGYDDCGKFHRRFVDRSTSEVDEQMMSFPQYDENASQGLVAVDLGGRSGKSEVIFLVLSAIHSRLNSLGRGNADLSGMITGSVQIFSCIVPSLSAIGALQQFRMLYKGVTVEFVEQIGAIED